MFKLGRTHVSFGHFSAPGLLSALSVWAQQIHAASKRTRRPASHSERLAQGLLELQAPRAEDELQKALAEAPLGRRLPRRAAADAPGRQAPSPEKKTKTNGQEWKLGRTSWSTLETPPPKDKKWDSGGNQNIALKSGAARENRLRASNNSNCLKHG